MNIVLHHSCGVVVYFDSKLGREYLLLQYPEGHWDFVKGHIDEDDLDHLFTAKRELQEETGISEIEIQNGFQKTINYVYRRDGSEHKKRVDFFLAKVLNQKVVLSHEHHNFIWLTYDEAIKKLTFQNARDVLIGAELFLTV